MRYRCNPSIHRLFGLGCRDESKSIYNGFFEDEVGKGLYNFNGALCRASGSAAPKAQATLGWQPPKKVTLSTPLL